MTLFAAMEATWPPASTSEVEGWTIREGRGGGKRVSAATGSGDVSVAEGAMRALGQPALFQITDEGLDRALAARGYDRVDPTLIYTGDAARIADGAAADGSAYSYGGHLLARFVEIWRDGGIGPGRLAVMARAAGPKAYVFARTDTSVSGVGFACVAGDMVFVHAVEVAPAQRRQGAGAAVLAGAARFGLAMGATTLALAVTEANGPANGLYRKKGMEVAGRYHYRSL